MKFEIDEICKSCNGTGVYVGRAERGLTGIVCHTCEGTGCHHFVHEYEIFKKRKMRKDVKRILKINPGIAINEEERFGGMLYSDWIEGYPFPNKSEMRNFTCPAWWYQLEDDNRKPKWNECISIGSFSRCPYFSTKEKCWKRFDREEL